MKFKTGLVSLLVVCGACSQATKEADVVKDSFDFAGQQLKYAFTQIDSAKASMPEEQQKRKPVSPRTIEDNGALRLVASETGPVVSFPVNCGICMSIHKMISGRSRHRHLPLT